MICRNIFAVFIAIFFLTGQSNAQSELEDREDEPMEIKITSSAFMEGEMIPAKHSFDKENISPPLEWHGIPEGTKSIAIISDDPDAPRGTWAHWVIFNIPPAVKGLPENIPDKKVLDDGTRQGTNDFRRVGYGGPCPPSGTHRYYFKIYALDTELGIHAGANKGELINAMEGHILGQGQLMGKYKR